MTRSEAEQLGVDVAWILGEGRCDHLKMRHHEQTGLWSAESLGLLECVYSRSTNGHRTLNEAVAELRRLIEADGG